MEKIRYIIAALAVFACTVSGWAQTSRPATTKHNQSQTEPANAATTDPALSNSTNQNKSTNRTDSIVTTQKEGTSILTAPGTRNKKSAAKKTTIRKKTSAQ